MIRVPVMSATRDGRRPSHWLWPSDPATRAAAPAVTSHVRRGGPHLKAPAMDNGAQEGNKQSEDPRSFSERIAELKEPDVVDQPDEGKLQASLAAINDKIRTCDKRLVRESNYEFTFRMEIKKADLKFVLYMAARNQSGFGARRTESRQIRIVANY